jgi:hypothetical protein
LVDIKVTTWQNGGEINYVKERITFKNGEQIP